MSEVRAVTAFLQRHGWLGVDVWPDESPMAAAVRNGRIAACWARERDATIEETGQFVALIAVAAYNKVVGYAHA